MNIINTTAGYVQLIEERNPNVTHEIPYGKLWVSYKEPETVTILWNSTNTISRMSTLASNLQVNGTVYSYAALQGMLINLISVGSGGGAGGFEVRVVSSLPARGENGVIYLVGSSAPYDEYLWIESSRTFEKIGSSAIDLTDYYTKDEVDDLLEDIEDELSDVVKFNDEDNIELREGTKILGVASDTTEHEIIGLNEYDISGTTYNQVEVGSETIHLNLNTNNDPNYDIHITVDTPQGKKIIAYTDDSNSSSPFKNLPMEEADKIDIKAGDAFYYYESGQKIILVSMTDQTDFWVGNFDYNKFYIAQEESASSNNYAHKIRASTFVDFKDLVDLNIYNFTTSVVTVSMPTNLYTVQPSENTYLLTNYENTQNFGYIYTTEDSNGGQMWFEDNMGVLHRIITNGVYQPALTFTLIDSNNQPIEESGDILEFSWSDSTNSITIENQTQGYTETYMVHLANNQSSINPGLSAYASFYTDFGDAYQNDEQYRGIKNGQWAVIPVAQNMIDDSNFDATDKALSAKRVGNIEVKQAVDKDEYVVVEVQASTNGEGYVTGDQININGVDVTVKEEDLSSDWSTVTFPATTNRYGIATDGKGKWIIVNNGNTADVSTDNGATWSTFTFPTSADRYGIATDGNGTWIATRSSGNIADISTDNGVTWNEFTFLTSAARYGIATDGNGKWIAIRVNNTNIADISIDNGVTWSEFTFPATTNRYGIATDGNGKWITSRVSNTNIADISIDNGVTWSTFTFPATANRYGIATDGNGKWIAVRTTGNIADVSTDNGVTWSEFNFSTSIGRLGIATDGKGKWIIVNNGNTADISTNIIKANTYLTPDNILEKYNTDPAGTNLPATGGSGTGLNANISTSYSANPNGQLIDSTIKYVSASDELITESALDYYLNNLPSPPIPVISLYAHQISLTTMGNREVITVVDSDSTPFASVSDIIGRLIPNSGNRFPCTGESSVQGILMSLVNNSGNARLQGFNGVIISDMLSTIYGDDVRLIG